MLNTRILFLIVFGVLSLTACGQKFQAQKSQYTYENPNNEIPVVMRPTSTVATKNLKVEHKIEFLDPKIEVSLKQKSVRFTVNKVTDNKAELIELKGSFDDKNEAWLTDSAPLNGKNRLKAYVNCLNSDQDNIDCSNMFIELYFKSNGQNLKHQLEVNPYTKPETNIEDENLPQAPEDYELSVDVDLDESEGHEGTGEETSNGHYITPAPDENYWNDLQALLEQNNKSAIQPVFHQDLDLSNSAQYIRTAFDLTNPFSSDLSPGNKTDNNLWKLRLTEGGRAKGAYFSMLNTQTRKKESGRILETSSSIPKVGSCYTRYSDTEKSFATGYAVDFAEQSTCEFNEKYKDCDLVNIGNLSNAKGGPVRFEKCGKNGKCYHTSHQNGLEYDIHYLSKECTYNYLKIVANAKNQLGQYVAHTIFVQPSIKQEMCKAAKAKKLKSDEDKRLFQVLNSESGHADHTHIRLKCSPGHTGCWQQDELKDVVYIKGKKHVVTCNL